ncbi:hypothetical protein WA026_002673 [Henosepilachna vigintioctopunctata]|uniref:RING-type domain-containing protein n=1 Tax=Henosepilachna vigintioctopunctata TaxID=420089 RepID=A0AAW1U1Y5_9CUCU
MYRTKKPFLFNLNEHITCYLCRGYFIDATTIIECLHTFCRSCIVKYLESTKYCPICDVQVHKSKPLLSLRSDKIIQDIVYKLVPRLFNNEIQKRKEFYRKHPEAKPSISEECLESYNNSILMPDEELCLTLNYHGSTTKPRYLRCPSAVSMMHLQKLIRAKFDLSDSHHIDILHNQDCLNPCYTLMDIMYIYKLSKLEPLDLTYRIYEYMAKKMKIENRESKLVTPDEASTQPTYSNNNNWKEVQLRISENGEMSITGIQDANGTQNFTPEMIEVLDANSLAPSAANSITNPVKKKDLPDLKFIGRSQSSSNIKILKNETIIGPFCTQNNICDSLVPSISVKTTCNPMTLEVSNMDNSNIVSTISMPCMNATTTTVFSTINSTKCSIGTTENTLKNSAVIDIEVENAQENIKKKEDDFKIINDKTLDKGVKRKGEISNSIGPKRQNNLCGRRHEYKAPVTLPYVSNVKVAISKVSDTKCQMLNHIKSDKILESESSCGNSTEQGSEDISIESNSTVTILPKSEHSGQLNQKSNPLSVDGRNTPKNELKNSKSTSSQEVLSSNVNSKQNEIAETGASYIAKSLSNCAPAAPKPSTKYQGPTQPCYMPKTVYNPLVNVPKPQLCVSASKSESKTQAKTVMTSKNDIKSNLVTSSSASTISTSNLNSNVTNAKTNSNAKPKSNAPLGYKTLRDPPKSWNSQISKANITKPLPDPKYSDLKNARPAKFFKMRNNMLRFLGNPASGVKPMYSVHVGPETEKPQEKVLENREIKKHSIVKIDPKTLKPISEKAPETSNLSSQVSATTDLKINTSSVSIFNPLKLQSNSPKSDRKSPKSPQSPKAKTSSLSPSPPVHKRDKPNLNFTPANPFVPNLSSQTINPNQFLCNSVPPGFAPYDPRVMAAAAYHNLFHGSLMGFPPSPLPYHLGGMDINQRTKGFDISKIVGMQQPATNKVGSKMDSPSIPPQVPYQPRPSPMALKNPLIGVKRATPHKDVSKNEKSLKNAVEKLTLNRTKEIHRTEMLNKSLGTAAALPAHDHKIITTDGENGSRREVSRPQPYLNCKPVEKAGNKAITAETCIIMEDSENTKPDKPSSLSSNSITEIQTAMDRPKSDATVETKSVSPQQLTPPPSVTNTLGVGNQTSEERFKIDDERDVMESPRKPICVNSNNDHTLRTSDDSKTCNVNNNETTNNAGSDISERVSGDK